MLTIEKQKNNLKCNGEGSTHPRSCNASLLIVVKDVIYGTLCTMGLIFLSFNNLNCLICSNLELVKETLVNIHGSDC